MSEAGMQGARGRGGAIAICALVASFAFGLFAQSAAAEPPIVSKVGAFAVTGTSAMLRAEIDPQGATTTFRFEYGAEDCETSTCTVVASGSIPEGSPVKKEASLEGLSPGTLYHFRVVAKHGSASEARSGDRILATRTAAFSGLPDGRAYEQVSPTNKDGGDLQGYTPLIKATESGGGITFESTFGVPGGKGAQEFPTYLARRGTASWSTEGLLPPFSVGQRAQVAGWSPDFTEIFSVVTLLGDPRASALIVQATDGSQPVQITPYVPFANGTGPAYEYVDQSSDGSVVLFESTAKLVPEAIAGFFNLYAWDRETGQLSLAGIDNHETSPPKGTLAGAYLWALGSGGRALRLGGSQSGLYLRDERAVAPDGSVYFTEAGTGQLFRRIHPTAEQSATTTNGKGEEECSDPAKACTVHISASHKTNGKGKGGADSAGPQPAAFQAASADGSEVFFTSPQKLTDDANTGPEQAPAQIELGNPVSGAIEKPDFIPRAALGVAVDGSHVYWVDPSGTIGRSDLNGTNREAEFIVPGPSKCEVAGKPGVFEDVPAAPRYLAVDAKYLYWTNTGCSGGEIGAAIEGTGTIGRADISGPTPTEINPAFIKGASNPQGIAVNSEHIYWANAGGFGGTRAIGWATTDGGEVNQEFIKSTGSEKPYGVALSPTHLYFGSSVEGTDSSFVIRFTLDGKEEKFLGLGKEGIRGVAVDAGHVYWATQGEEAIGRADLELTLASREKEFIPLEGKPTGVAVDGAHLYWSTNGEAPTNPGDDLYRYGPGKGELEDLTPDPTGNGAEVQGVLGASADGKYVYFAANGVLDDGGEAEAGTCKGPLVSASGSCSLYLWHDGAISLIARLQVSRNEASDTLNWVPTPRELFATTSYFAKSAFLSADGKTLLFRSQEQLTPYDNEGVPEFYRFAVGDPAKIRCVSCNSAGEAAGEGPGTGRLHFEKLGPLPTVAATSTRVLSASGDQAFFETAEALVPEDTNGQGGCPSAGPYPACLDVYEWEAPGAEAGSCQESSPAYSPLNGGCIYLISTGKSKYPSLFADASASGKDVFFFSRDQLVGQDKDEIQDVYDARVDGGLASQNPSSVIPCEAAESCHGAPAAPPAESSPATPSFVGPTNPKPKHKKQKAKKHKGKGKGKKHKHKGHKRHKRANAKGGTAR